MLGAVLILPAIFLTAYATGEFSILVSPKSLTFKGDEKLNSAYLSDVYAASLGRSVSGSSQWGGLYLNDPFALPDTAFAVIVDGVDHLKLNAKAKSYSLVGSETDESINALSSTLNVADVDLNEGADKVDQFSEVLGDIEITAIPKSTNNLKPDLHSEDKLFLQQIAVLNKLSETLASNSNLPELTIIRLSLTPVQTAHGEKSPAALEAQELLNEAIEKLAASAQANPSDILFTAIATRADLLRAKRQAPTPDPKTLNLAAYYNEDYPVIFNIILWFMVVIAFSLLAISYAIATMDPGRDSIIYRMTSTRMKKEN